MKPDKKISRVDKGWNNMANILDKEMPQDKKKRRLFIWLFFGLGLLIGFSYTMFLRHDTPQVEKKIKLTENTNKETTLTLSEKPASSLNDKSSTTATNDTKELSVNNNPKSEYKSSLLTTEKKNKLSQNQQSNITEHSSASNQKISKSNLLKDKATPNPKKIEQQKDIETKKSSLYSQLIMTKDGLLLKEESKYGHLKSLPLIATKHAQLEYKKSLLDYAIYLRENEDIEISNYQLDIRAFVRPSIVYQYMTDLSGHGIGAGIDLGIGHDKFSFGLAFQYSFFKTNFFEDRTFVFDQDGLFSELKSEQSVDPNTRGGNALPPITSYTVTANNDISYPSLGVFTSYQFFPHVSTRVGIGYEWYKKEVESMPDLSEQDINMPEDMDDQDTEVAGSNTEMDFEQVIIPLDIRNDMSRFFYAEVSLSIQTKDNFGLLLGYRRTSDPRYRISNYEVGTSKLFLGISKTF